MLFQRSSETQEQREVRLSANADRMTLQRSSDTVEQRTLRMAQDAARHASHRLSQNNEEHQANLLDRRNKRQQFMRKVWGSFKAIGFNYDPTLDYNNHDLLSIGTMNIPCGFCGALRWKKEPVGLCCSKGKVNIPALDEPPEPLLTLLAGETVQSKDFLKNVRKYNMCFQMTSFGTSGQVVPHDFPTTFTVQGQICHRVGSLLPPPTQPHSFLQIYFVGDRDVETDRRCNNIPGVCRTTIERLQQMLHEENQLVRSFKSAIDRLPTNEYKVVIRADRYPPGEHERRYNAPSTDEVAIVMVGNEFEKRDIVLQKRDDTLIRVSETHRFYDALQYPLIFWKGQEGYHFGIRLINPTTNRPTDKKVTSMDFYAYMIMVRQDSFNSILRYKQLLNQFIVDMYAKIETERLLYIKLNQAKLRSESYVHLRDALANDVGASANDLGQAVILPSSFVGSPRYLSERAQDALMYVKHYGRPDLFITMTCNPRWIEIVQSLLPGQSATDRHDIVSRVFNQKVKVFMDVITKGEVFGTVRCWIYSVEWQKRGLPHIHLLLWLFEKIRPHQIDSVISSEIPDQNADPVLHGYVLKHMVHGPCGAQNQKSPCMKNGKCTKRYPRSLLKDTQSNDEGYPLYRRRSTNDGGFTGEIRMAAAGNATVEIDNRWIVPFSPILTKMFDAHINVEYCNSVKAIKYICKYVHKGSDQAVFNLVRDAAPENRRDEVTIYQSGRYLSSNEAAWRIFGFSVHDRSPTVTHLSVHLENGQRVYFNENNMLERLQNPPSTTLTAFFSLCRKDNFAKTLLYHEVPHFYTFDLSRKEFKRRIRGTPVNGHQDIKYSDALGRVYTVHPANFECYCLRLLLHKVPGPTSFEFLRTVNNHMYGTYREACEVLGLLESDNHWEATMQEAVLTRSATRVRHLFAVLISTCGLSNPLALWEMFKNDLASDILHRHRQVVPDLQYNDIVYNETLIAIQDFVKSMCGKDLSSFGLPAPQVAVGINAEVIKEMSYNTHDMQRQVHEMLPKLLPEQRTIFNAVLQKIEQGKGAILFLDAPGGTGKTFLINLLLAQLRKDNHVALAVASSGIASTLLQGGRTAHSALKLPLNLATADSAQCNISKTSDRAEVLKRCKLLVWDECTMSHKRAFEALNVSLRDIRSSNDLMGGLVVLLAGDFRQTLPVIQRGTPADEINASLKKSVLWSHIEQFHLTQNMRVHLHNDLDAGKFSTDLLKIGDGTIRTDDQQQIVFPNNFGNLVASSDELISKVFPDLPTNIRNADWLQCRAVLAPKNDTVNKLNDKILSFVPGETTSYLSIDRVMEEEQAVHYPVEFLNTLELPGVPPHKLDLKVGIPVMLLRNLEAPRLCNGTRMLVKALKNNVIEATILTGCAKGEDVLIPRIPIIPSDLPFTFKRLQFPLKVAFSMTINKSQGQTLQVAGLHLESQCFSHGQLYVACSRVSSSKNLHIFTPDKKAVNIVYKSVL